jgi:hypothetical protein
VPLAIGVGRSIAWGHSARREDGGRAFVTL